MQGKWVLGNSIWPLYSCALMHTYTQKHSYIWPQHTSKGRVVAKSRKLPLQRSIFSSSGRWPEHSLEFSLACWQLILKWNLSCAQSFNYPFRGSLGIRRQPQITGCLRKASILREKDQRTQSGTQELHKHQGGIDKSIVNILWEKWRRHGPLAHKQRAIKAEHSECITQLS